MDRGSKLLLKALARNPNLGRFKSALDLGCGVGALGISLKKQNPGLELIQTDRDALALAFSRLNARLNKITPVTVRGGLGFSMLQGKSFDLIVSNLPAKAGSPVLKDIFFSFSRHLAEHGLFAFVIVDTLRELAEESLSQAGAEILFLEQTKEHSVFMVQVGQGAETTDSLKQAICLSPYIRERASFRVGGLTYSLNTVYDLPDFDTLSYEARLAMELLGGIGLQGRVLFWNPGQGHLPVFISKAMKHLGLHYSLAGRDLLQLAVSEENLRRSGIPKSCLQVHHLPFLKGLAGPFGALIILPNRVPGPPWPDSILTDCGDLLAKKGYILLVAKSVYAHRILKYQGDLKLVTTKKNKGIRALLLKKR